MRRRRDDRLRPNRPTGALGDSDTRVLLAVLGGLVVYSDLCAATGLNKPSLHASLHRLRDAGLVDFTPGQQGTMRPLVRLVAVAS